LDKCYTDHAAQSWQQTVAFTGAFIGVPLVLSFVTYGLDTWSHGGDETAMLDSDYMMEQEGVLSRLGGSVTGLTRRKPYIANSIRSWLISLIGMTFGGYQLVNRFILSPSTLPSERGYTETIGAAVDEYKRMEGPLRSLFLLVLTLFYLHCQFQLYHKKKQQEKIVLAS
jgi:hypothetical protein